MKKRTKGVLAAALAAAGVFLLAGLDARLLVRAYTVESGRLTGPVRLAVLTDLHACAYGQGQRELLDAVLCGRPSIIVENGKLHQREMQKNRFTVDELMEELRMKGITDLNSIKYAILETNGQISVLPYAAQQPVTAAQMELHPKEPGLPLVIINDGRVLEHNLRQRGLDDIWLDRQLKAHHVKRSQDVFLLTVDEQNQVYLAEKEGRV